MNPPGPRTKTSNHRQMDLLGGRSSRESNRWSGEVDSPEDSRSRKIPKTFHEYESPQSRYPFLNTHFMNQELPAKPVEPGSPTGVRIEYDKSSHQSEGALTEPTPSTRQKLEEASELYKKAGKLLAQLEDHSRDILLDFDRSIRCYLLGKIILADRELSSLIECLNRINDQSAGELVELREQVLRKL